MSLSTNLQVRFISDEAQDIYKEGIKYQTEGSSGFDLRALTVTEFSPLGKEFFNLRPEGYDYKIHVSNESLDIGTPKDVPFYMLRVGARALVGCGLFFAIDEAFDVQVRSRSGMALKNGVFVANSPGTVDSDYRGEICVILANIGSEDFKISLGDRVAQVVVTPLVKVSFNIVTSLDDTVRGDGGFGSTGSK